MTRKHMFKILLVTQLISLGNFCIVVIEFIYGTTLLCVCVCVCCLLASFSNYRRKLSNPDTVGLD